MADDVKEAPEAKGGKMRLILMVVPVLLLVAGAGWFFLIKPSSAGAAKALPPPKPGAVVKLDDITVNLAGVHYLKIGLALQPTAAAKEVDGSEALDLAITVFSGQTMDELSTATGRDRAKEELLARIKLAYLPEGTETPAQTAALDAKFSNGKAKTDAALTDEQVIKRAAALTVQTEVYDIYFTDFVLQ